MIVPIKRKNLLIDVRDEEVHPAVFVEVCRIHAHTRTCPAISAVSDIGGQAHFVEAAAPVHEKKIRHCVVGDKEIHPAIVIYTGGNDSPGFSEMRGDAGLFADIRKSAVAVIMKKPARTRIEDARDAIVMRTVRVHAARKRFVELRELTDKQVEPAIVVVVEPHSARAPPWSGDTRFLRDIGECSIPVVVVKDAAAELRDEQIWEAVAIIIANRGSHAVAATGHAGFFSHTRERTIAVVAIERITQRSRRTVKIAFAAVD